MASRFSTDSTILQRQIATTAARIIAEEGASYETAKRNAVRMILGNARINSKILPNNETVENELRRYNRLFLSKKQSARLQHLRLAAVQLLKKFQPFCPYITGAVLNGTAGEHSSIHIQLFTDNAKDVELFLLNEGIPFEVGELAKFRKNNRIIETIEFFWRNEAVCLIVYEPNDLRRPDRFFGEYAKRADLAHLIDIINDTPLHSGDAET